LPTQVFDVALGSAARLYAQLVRRQAKWNAAHGLRVASAEYFPAYRYPTVAIERKPVCETALSLA